MPSLTVRPYEPADLPALLDLLAARQRRDRARTPFLLEALEDPKRCQPWLEALLRSPRSTAMVAERAGRIVGYMAGEMMLLPPDHFASQFIPPHSASIPAQGHAAAEGEDVTDVYRALYAALAGPWVEQGFFTHRANIVPSDAAVQEAFVTLGFGRYLTAATRTTGEVRNTAGAKVQVHQASSEDIDVVMDLAHTLNLHHVQAPMFWPLLRTTDKAARDFNIEVLESGEAPYFVAYENGEPIGMQTFLRPGFTPTQVDRDRDVYLYEGVIDPRARSGGLGSALLAHSMNWAREQGFETCTLHFASGNPSGAPFWLGHGFTPVEHTMERRIDERIAWARG